MFLDFIYSDNIHTPLVPGSNDVVELLLVADEYEMPRLRSICEAGMATGESDMEYVNPSYSHHTRVLYLLYPFIYTFMTIFTPMHTRYTYQLVYIHHMYTIYTPNTLNTHPLNTHPIYTLYSP